jgi:hypothetical protein
VSRRLLLLLGIAEARAPYATVSSVLELFPMTAVSAATRGLRRNRAERPRTHAGGTRIDASATFAAVVASSFSRAISSTIAVV